MASSQPPPYENVVTVLPATMETTMVTTMVTTSLPVYEPDHMQYSFLTMLWCFPPLGIAAFVFSYKTRSCNRRGDAAGARENSRTSLILNHISLGIGILVTIAYVSFLIYYLTRDTSSSGYYSSGYYYYYG